MTTRFVGKDRQVFTMVAVRDGKDVTEMEITYDRVK